MAHTTTTQVAKTNQTTSRVRLTSGPARRRTSGFESRFPVQTTDRNHREPQRAPSRGKGKKLNRERMKLVEQFSKD